MHCDITLLFSSISHLIIHVLYPIFIFVQFHCFVFFLNIASLTLSLSVIISSVYIKLDMQPLIGSCSWNCHIYCYLCFSKIPVMFVSCHCLFCVSLLLWCSLSFLYNFTAMNYNTIWKAIKNYLNYIMYKMYMWW